MVQIISRTRPTFGEQVASGLESGFKSGSGVAEHLIGQKSKEKEFERKQSFAQQIMEDPMLKNLPEETRRLLALEAAGITSAQSTKSSINTLRDLAAQEQLSKISQLAGGQGFPATEAAAGTEPTAAIPTPTKEGTKAPQIDYDSQISALQPFLASSNPAISKAASENIANLRKQQEFAFKQEQAAKKEAFQKGQMEFQEAKPTVEHANNLTMSLPNQLQDLEGLEQALKNKNFGFFSRDNLAEMSGVEAFRSPEGAQFKSSIKNYFLGDVKGVGGKGLNQWLEKQLNDAMLKIGRDNAANEVVLSGFKAKYDRDAKWLDEYRKLYKKQKEEQGYISGDIGQEVFEKVKPYYEARQKQLEAEIKAIKKSGQGLSGKMVDVLGPDGFEYEIDESQVGDLPEGWRMK